MARKLRCWTRKTSNKKSYVVCSGSNGQKRRKSKRLKKKRQRGGVKPFVGQPWTSSPSTWPGVGGTDGVTNHYALAKNVMPLPVSTSQIGGKKLRHLTRKASNKIYVVRSGSKGQKRLRSKRLRKKSRQRGGKGTTLMPQSLVNTGRAIGYQAQSMFNSFRGLHAPVNPNPDVQPAMEKSAKATFNTDKISNIYSSAQKQVGGI